MLAGIKLFVCTGHSILFSPKKSATSAFYDFVFCGAGSNPTRMRDAASTSASVSRNMAEG